jgi:hypothetical protein
MRIGPRNHAEHIYSQVAMERGEKKQNLQEAAKEP